MQTLYTVASLEAEAKPGEPQKILQQHFDRTQELLTYFTWFLTEVARYPEKDAHQRANKHLPTKEDLNVNIKLAGNELLWTILDEPSFQAQIGATKPQARTNEELIRKIYQRLKDTPEYLAYINTPERNKNDERGILEFILNNMLLEYEPFTAHIEEMFSNWDDDGEMVIQLIAGGLQKPHSLKFSNLLNDDKKQFAFNLTRTVLEKKEYLQELIVPKLKNWDAERIALLDMILMQMGVSEFLYFDTIPPKVTINEYIDLAKEYSTQQSGQFVNGILDNINKDLATQGKMQKRDHRKP